MADINLSKAVRSNLTSLQNTATLMAKTQDRLSTGNKVNSALDNPTNFFTAASLNSRAGDLNNLMDSMANGIKTLEAADNGLTAITKNLESMQSTLRQARQDKSFMTESFDVDATAIGTTTKSLSLKGGAIGDTAVDIELVKNLGATAAPATASTIAAPTFTALTTGQTGSFKVSDGTNEVTVNLDFATGDTAAHAQAAIQAQLDTAGVAVTVASDLAFTSKAKGADAAVVISGQTGQTGGIADATGTGQAAAVEGPRAKTTDELVNDINSQLKGLVRASNDNGKLRIENLSTQKLDITGASGGKVNGSTTATADIDGNSVRSDLAKQFNELRDQLDKLSDDASFNGINLLRGDNLKITFNETGTSSIDIQTKDKNSVNAANLKLETTLTAKDLDSDDGIDGFLDQVKGALNNVRAQASAFGSNLSIVQNRQDFTKSMINTLETGAGNLTLADMNQEAANMMALQTRQSLASSTLSMANQADQNVLQLLR
ncbi:MAG TPA: flagellin [Devosia sp.]|nr:flagellin [Devosia sp.]